MRRYIQLHWQNPKNVSETKFVLQISSTNLDLSKLSLVSLRVKLEIDRGFDRPDGWIAMICDDTARCFQSDVPADRCIDLND